MMNIERINALVAAQCHKTFLSAQPLPQVDPFIIGRDVRRLGFKLPQGASQRMQDGWLFADLQIRDEVAHGCKCVVFLKDGKVTL